MMLVEFKLGRAMFACLCVGCYEVKKKKEKREKERKEKERKKMKKALKKKKKSIGIMLC